MRTLIIVAFWGSMLAWSQAPSGRWDASVTVDKLKIPFMLHFQTVGDSLSAEIGNGEARIRSDSGSFDGKTVKLQFQKPATRMEATLADGELKGVFGVQNSRMWPFRASPFCTCGFAGEAGPEIMGTWVTKTGPEGRLEIRRVSEDTVVTLLRDGKTIGPLSGRFNGAFFELSFFDGERTALLEIEPRKDGGLDLTLLEPGAPPNKFSAVRAARP